MTDTHGKQGFSGMELFKKKKKKKICGNLYKGTLSDVIGSVLLQHFFLNSKWDRELIYSILEKWQEFKIEFNSVKAILWEVCNYYGPNVQLWFKAWILSPKEQGRATTCH